jgi:FolB domain-containing protein
MDKIRIRDLRVRCRVGVTAHERRLPQELLITVTLHADLRRACRSDDLRHTIDYSVLKKAILAESESKPYKLIERLAQRIAELSLESPLVQQVDVRVQKLGALRFAFCSEVEITRVRDER